MVAKWWCSISITLSTFISCHSTEKLSLYMDSLCISQGSPEKQNKYLSIYLSTYLSIYLSIYLGDLLYGIGSCDNGGWRIPQSAICKLETQKASGAVWRPETQGSWWYRFLPKSEDLRTRSTKEGRTRCPISSNQAERGQIPPSSTFFFYSGPQWIRWCPPALGRAICFTQPSNSNANLFPKHSYRHTQK